jgi:hypothetical protein
VTYRPAHLTYDQLRNVVENFRAQYDPTDEIPVDAEQIAEYELGFTIRRLDGIFEDTEVYACLASDLTTLFVDEQTYTHRYKDAQFSIAHEIGHFVLHKSFYAENRIARISDYRGIMDALGDETHSRMEWQAQNFAGLLLVPTAALLTLLTAARSAAKDHGFDGDVLASEAGFTYAVGWLAAQFDVATRVIEKRLEFEGLWSPPTRRVNGD